MNEELKTIELVHIPETPFIALAKDTNLTPRAIAAKSIMIEQELADLPEVKALKRGDCVIDVGAFVGDTALIFGKNGASVFAIESQQDSYLCAHWNCLRFPNILTINIAVGDGARVSCKDDAMEGNLGTRTTALDPSGERSKTLDELVEDLHLVKVTCIKADCEGHELHVLRGAVETIKKFKPILIIEIFHELLDRQGSSAERIYKLLEKMGYEWRVAIGDESEPRFDLIAKPKESLSTTAPLKGPVSTQKFR